MPPQRQEFKLSPADKRGVVKLIRSNNLLVADSIELPEATSPSRYFGISLTLTLDKKKGEIKISGPRTAVQVKEEKLYQDTSTLIKELHRIMNTQDQSVHLEELVLEP